LPDTVFELLLQILEGMQQGKAISIVPVMQDLTTQQAAGLLGVSRPFFIKLLESGKLPFHLTGTYRRVYLKDLLVYKEHRDRERRDALDQMAREAGELGLYDKVLLPTNEFPLSGYSRCLRSSQRGTSRYAAAPRGASVRSLTAAMDTRHHG
jgi:excisionase family DNA binding protein